MDIQMPVKQAELDLRRFRIFGNTERQSSAHGVVKGTVSLGFRIQDVQLFYDYYKVGRMYTRTETTPLK